MHIKIKRPYMALNILLCFGINYIILIIMGVGMKLYLIRHGETDWNIVHKLQGRSDIPLNENGRRLARITSEAVSGIPFTRIYTSPLIRAYETAEILRAGRNIPIIRDERIIEICFGEYEGMYCGKDNYNIPDPDFRNFFDHTDRYYAKNGAESLEEMCIREKSFLDDILKLENTLENPDGEHILISTHGAAIKGLLTVIRKLELKDFWGDGVHKNCALTTVSVENGIFKVMDEGHIYY